MRPNFQIQVILLMCGCLLLGGVSDSAAQDGPQSVSALIGFERGIQQGKYAAVERPLLAYARSNPQNTRALELVARMRLLQGRLDEAKALYTRVLTLDPKFALAKVFFGVTLIQTGDPEAARRMLTEVDLGQLSDSKRILTFANALMNAGESERAISVIETLPVPVQDNEALPVSIAASIELKDEQRIDHILKKAKNTSIKNPGIALEVAEILINASMGSRAVDLLRPIVPPVSKSVRSLTLLAKAEIQASHFDAARIRLGRASLLEPRSVDVLLAQAMLENFQGNARAALGILEKAALVEPDSTQVLEQIAMTAIRANSARRAFQAAERLVEKRPNDPNFLYVHGAAALQSGRLETAQRSLERFVLLRPKDSRGCLALGLTKAAHNDQIDAARQQLLRCIEIDPSNYEARYQLGLSYKTQGDAVTAIRFFEETAAIAPNYPLVLRDLGMMYLQMGDEAKARAVLERSVGLDASDADTHFQLSRLYNLTGERELARKHLELFQKLKNGQGNSSQ